MKDIENKKHIEIVVRTFYDKVKVDELLAPYFTDIIPVKWEVLVPLMVDFWDNALFFTGGYKGNPMERHIHLNSLEKIRQIHFDRWLELFYNSIDESFSGQNCDTLKYHAQKIAIIMTTKLAN